MSQSHWYWDWDWDGDRDGHSGEANAQEKVKDVPSKPPHTKPRKRGDPIPPGRKEDNKACAKLIFYYGGTKPTDDEVLQFRISKRPKYGDLPWQRFRLKEVDQMGQDIPAGTDCPPEEWYYVACYAPGTCCPSGCKIFTFLTLLPKHLQETATDGSTSIVPIYIQDFKCRCHNGNGD